MPKQIDYKYQLVYHRKSIFRSFFQNEVVLLLLTCPNNRIEPEMAYITKATLDKLACTNCVDFGECHDRFGLNSWSKISFDYLDVKLKVFQKDENKQFRLAENLTMGEADSRNENFCLKWTLYNGRRTVSKSFKTDMDKLNIVVYRYRNKTYVRD